MRTHCGDTQPFRQAQHLPVGLRKFLAAEEAKQFDGSHFAPLLPQLSHLHYGKKDTADDDGSADDLCHVGEAGQVIHGLLLK